MVYENDAIEPTVITCDVFSDNVHISWQFTYTCNSFYEYLRVTGKDIKVWQCDDGDSLLLVDNKVVRCHINIQSKESLTDADSFYLNLFRWYKTFFDSHPNVRYIPGRSET